MLLLMSMNLQPESIITPVPPSGTTGSVPIPAQSIKVIVGLQVVTITIPSYTITVRAS